MTTHPTIKAFIGLKDTVIRDKASRVGHHHQDGRDDIILAAIDLLTSGEWAVVPVNPTGEMLNAGNEAGDWGYHENAVASYSIVAGNPGEIYRAMLAASTEGVK